MNQPYDRPTRPTQPNSRTPLNHQSADPFSAGRPVRRRTSSRLLRRVRWPAILFLLTCLSTFWVGVTNWQPVQALFVCTEQGNLTYVRQLFLNHWQQGLTYMGCVLAILVLHELGHFVMTLIYRIPATMPIFLPFPFNPIGTLGAVIGMNGFEANRKQIFDIGIAGPLAGLLVAIPLAWIGANRLDLSIPPAGGLSFQCPLFLDWLIERLQVPGYNGSSISPSQMNPFFSAAWVGCLVTGLNMIPVGQLDGGHITYALFGQRAHFLARALIVGAIASMVYFGHMVLLLMVILVVLVGTDHPPTANDRMPLGWFRYGLGLLSLSIPILLFPPMVFELPS